MRIIKKTCEFNSIYQKHKKFFGKIFIVLYQYDPSTEESAVGLVISKKVGKAVVRNKVKRRMRAFLRENENLLFRNNKVIIIAKREAGSSSWLEIKTDLRKSLTKITSDENF